MTAYLVQPLNFYSWRFSFIKNSGKFLNKKNSSPQLIIFNTDWEKISRKENFVETGSAIGTGTASFQLNDLNALQQRRQVFALMGIGGGNVQFLDIAFAERRCSWEIP